MQKRLMDMHLGYYGVPEGLPNHVDVHFQIMWLEHFDQYIIVWFGVHFLEDIRNKDIRKVLKSQLS